VRFVGWFEWWDGLSGFELFKLSGDWNETELWEHEQHKLQKHESTKSVKARNYHESTKARKLQSTNAFIFLRIAEQIRLQGFH